jgi:hypothetical protein
VLATGLVAFSLRPALEHPARFAGLGLFVGALSLGAVAWWPYFPWFHLIRTGSETYAAPNLAMYDGVLMKTFPVLLGVPCLAGRVRRDRLDGLSLFVAGLAAIYIVGAIRDNGILGRVLPALVLGLHIALAGGAARFEEQVRHTGGYRARRALRVALILVVVAGTLNAVPAIVRMIPRPLLPATIAADPRLERTLDVYHAAARHVEGDAVVLGDLNVSRFFPALAGKVVAFVDPEAFVPDHDERRRAVDRFFCRIPLTDRRAIASAYDVAFVAVDRRFKDLDPIVRSDIERIGSLVHDDGRLLLFRLTAAR